MIRLYSGTPGSGKSLHNASDVINRSRFGKPVIGNFPCDLSKYPKAKYTYVPNYQLNPDFLIKYSREYFAGKRIKEGSILVVIDECQLMFNSRDWQQKGRNEWLAFFTQHRKYGYDITLIAQFDRMIDRQIRGVIEYEYVHRKMSNYGIGGKIMSLLFGGNTFVVVQMWYPLKLKVGSQFVHAHKRLYSIYDTFGTFDVDSPSPSSSPAGDAGKSNAETSTTEEQKQPETAQARQDPTHRAAILSLLRKLLPARFRKLYPLKLSSITLGKWRLYSTGGKYLKQFPEGRNEFGWKGASL